MRKYRVDSLDPRDDTIINIEIIKADFFMVPVAMFPFKYVVSIIPDFVAEEGDSE